MAKEIEGPQRLDKLVSAQTGCSRKDARKLIMEGRVLCGGKPCKDPGEKADLQKQTVFLDGQALSVPSFCYLMLNKPKGVLCAVRDARTPTVLDYVPENLRRRGLFPAGRLDKDTQGFVLLTDDGALAHRMLSPRSHVPKTYTVKLDKPWDEKVAEGFSQGVLLPPERAGEEAVTCLPAQLEETGGDRLWCRVVIRQGVYHQIKRMFAVFGLRVVELRREKIGALALDGALRPGEYRMLTGEEIPLLLQGREISCSGAASIKKKDMISS